MKLLTKEIERKFEKFPFYSQDGKGKDADVIAKFFNPCGSQTWLVAEAEKQDDGDWHLYGWYEDSNGGEWAYFSLRELQSVKTWAGLGIERDIYIGNSNKVKDLARCWK